MEIEAETEANQTRRLTLRVSVETARRLGLHAALLGRRHKQGQIVDEILSAWLTEHGKGREMFEPCADGETRSAQMERLIKAC
jgi:hypothetical protein